MSNESLSGRWTAGNANDDSTNTRGWLVGHFINPSHDVRANKDLEVKWARHPAGEKRADWTLGDHRTTLVILISGEFRVDITGGSKTMDRQGDYVMWGPRIDHSWEAIVDSVVLTVRWPSASGLVDQAT
jgi:hypothetical protein